MAAGFTSHSHLTGHFADKFIQAVDYTQYTGTEKIGKLWEVYTDCIFKTAKILKSTYLVQYQHGA